MEKAETLRRCNRAWAGHVLLFPLGGTSRGKAPRLLALPRDERVLWSCAPLRRQSSILPLLLTGPSSDEPHTSAASTDVPLCLQLSPGWTFPKSSNKAKRGEGKSNEEVRIAPRLHVIKLVTALSHIVWPIRVFLPILGAHSLRVGCRYTSWKHTHPPPYLFLSVTVLALHSHQNCIFSFFFFKLYPQTLTLFKTNPTRAERSRQSCEEMWCWSFARAGAARQPALPAQGETLPERSLFSEEVQASPL